MAIAYVNAGTSVEGASGNVNMSPGYPASPVSGNLLVLHFAHVNSGGMAAATYSVDGTWTAIAVADSVSSQRQWLYYKISNGTETGTTTITVTGGNSSTNQQSAVIYQFSGVDTTSPYEASAVGTGTNTPVSDTDITTTSVNELVCNFIAVSQGANVTSFTGESGGDFTVTYNTTTATPRIGFNSAALASAGTIGGGTFAISGGTWINRGLALKPAAIGATLATTEADDTISSAAALALSGSLAAVADDDTLYSTAGIIFVNAGTGVEASAGNVNIFPGYPANPVAGNLLILHICHNNSATQVGATYSVDGTWTLISADTNVNQRQWLYYKISDGTETGTTTITVTGGLNTATQSAVIYQFAGVNTNSPYEGLVSNAGTSSPCADADVTTTGPGELACNFICYSQSNNISNFTGETGGDFTVTYAASAGASRLGFQSATLSAAGTIGGGTVTSSQNWMVRGLALKPILGGASIGTSTVTEDDETLSSAAVIAITGTLSVTSADDTLATTTTLAITGTSAPTEDDDTLATTTLLAITGTLAVTSDDDTIVSSSGVAVTGNLSLSSDDDTLSSASTLALSGTSAPTEDVDTLSSFGSALPTRVGDLDTVNDDDTIASAGVLAITAILDNTVGEDDDLLGSTAYHPGGDTAVTEGDDSISSAAGLGIAGSLFALEDNEVDVFSTASLAISGFVVKAEINDTLDADATVTTNINLNVVELDEIVTSKTKFGLMPAVINPTLLYQPRIHSVRRSKGGYRAIKQIR